MTAVFDTSPLHYLVLVANVDLVPLVFDRVLIPPEVLTELEAAGAPDAVREWAGRLPDWVEIRQAPGDPGRALDGLHVGERAAIHLARSIAADVVVLDDKAARTAALSLGLQITGLLGVLDLAAARGLVDLPAAVDRLRRTSFRATPALLQSLLAGHAGEEDRRH